MLSPLRCALAVALVALVSVTAGHGSSLGADGDVYQDELLQDLYKRLARLDDVYYSQDDVPSSPEELEPGAWQDDSAPLDVEARHPGQADIRDPEFLEHSPNAGSQGFMYMSGGAGEGKQHLTPDGSRQNVQEVKSDAALPFYCHPPNPCPKGFTGKDGCQEFIEDTAEAQKNWIAKMQQKGICSCDEEHMFDCPRDGDTINTDKAAEGQAALDDVLDKLLGEKHENNPFAGGQKRDSLVAKKSPRVRRNVQSDATERELERLRTRHIKHNPYLSGDRLPTVAKKGVPEKHH